MTIGEVVTFSVCLALVNFFFITVAIPRTPLRNDQSQRSSAAGRLTWSDFIAINTSVTLTISKKTSVEFYVFFVSFFHFEASWIFSWRRNERLLAAGLKDKAFVVVWTAAVTH